MGHSNLEGLKQAEKLHMCVCDETREGLLGRGHLATPYVSRTTIHGLAFWARLDAWTKMKLPSKVPRLQMMDGQVCTYVDSRSQFVGSGHLLVNIQC